VAVVVLNAHAEGEGAEGDLLFHRTPWLVKLRRKEKRRGETEIYATDSSHSYDSESFSLGVMAK
jgi:hypothetical protein